MPVIVSKAQNECKGEGYCSAHWLLPIYQIKYMKKNALCLKLSCPGLNITSNYLSSNRLNSAIGEANITSVNSEGCHLSMTLTDRPTLFLDKQIGGIEFLFG